MFDQVKVIVAAFTQKLENAETLRKYFWPFLVAIALAILILLYNSFMSYNFWKETLGRIGGFDLPVFAFILTCVIAIVIYWMMSSFSGTVLDYINRRVERTEGHLPMFISTILILSGLLTLDIYANLQGVSHVSENTTIQVQKNESTDIWDKLQAQIEEKEEDFDSLLAGSLAGGYGWFDKRGWNLNSSGKKLQRSLSDEIKQLRKQQSTLVDSKIAEHKDDKVRFESEVNIKKEAHTSLVYFAWFIALVLCFFISHYVDRAQAHICEHFPDCKLFTSAQKYAYASHTPSMGYHSSTQATHSSSEMYKGTNMGFKANTGHLSAHSSAHKKWVFYLDRYPIAVEMILDGATKKEAAQAQNCAITTIDNIKRTMRSVNLIE